MEFDAATAKALEVIYGSRDVLRRRALVREALAAGAGERILDVGCGPAFFVEELLEQVGPAGSVAGIDMSPAMLALAEHRVGSRDNVTLEKADASELPFEDASFDAAISVQVLEYVDDVPRALAELHRVLRPGGRLVVWDVDWETVSMHTSDSARMQRVLAAWDRHLVHRSLPRTLGRQMRDAAFVDVATAGHAFATTDFIPDAYGATLVAVIEKYLAGLPDFAAAERTAWADEQRAMGAAGEFYFACVQCCVSGRRAPP